MTENKQVKYLDNQKQNNIESCPQENLQSSNSSQKAGTDNDFEVIQPYSTNPDYCPKCNGETPTRQMEILTEKGQYWTKILCYFGFCCFLCLIPSCIERCKHKLYYCKKCSQLKYAIERKEFQRK